MLRAFEATIAEQNKRLGEMLGVDGTKQFLCQSYYDDNQVIQNCTCGRCADDYTVIPVRVKLPSGTEMTIEDGYVTDCDHAGASLEGVDREELVFDPLAGNYFPRERTTKMYVCDGCDETSVNGEDW